MPEDADLFSYLRIFAGVMTVLAGLYYLLSRQGDSRDDASSNAGGAGGGWQPAPGQYDIVPRTLPQNPFSGSQTPLADQLETAAAASVRLSRTIGLVYFEFPVLAALAAEQGATAADAVIQSLAQDFRRAVRATDNVAVLGHHQILVAICLLAGRKDLETVASRLSASARRRDLIEEGAPSLPVGLAIYPLDGYGGQELIDAAKRHYHELLPAPEIAPKAPAPPIVEYAEAAPARARKRSRRRPARKSPTPQPAE